MYMLTASAHGRLPPPAHPPRFQTRPRCATRSRARLDVAAGGVIDWVADHRKHHTFTDEEGVPHSPPCRPRWAGRDGHRTLAAPGLAVRDPRPASSKARAPILSRTRRSSHQPGLPADRRWTPPAPFLLGSALRAAAPARRRPQRATVGGPCGSSSCTTSTWASLDLPFFGSRRLRHRATGRPTLLLTPPSRPPGLAPQPHPSTQDLHICAGRLDPSGQRLAWWHAGTELDAPLARALRPASDARALPSGMNLPVVCPSSPGCGACSTSTRSSSRCRSGSTLILTASDGKARVAASIYALAVSGLLGTSALYHRVQLAAQGAPLDAASRPLDDLCPDRRHLHAGRAAGAKGSLATRS